MHDAIKILDLENHLLFRHDNPGHLSNTSICAEETSPKTQLFVSYWKFNTLRDSLSESTVNIPIKFSLPVNGHTVLQHTPLQSSVKNVAS